MIAYHGTTTENALAIITDGSFKKGTWFTPYFDEAKRYGPVVFSREFHPQGFKNISADMFQFHLRGAMPLQPDAGELPPVAAATPNPIPEYIDALRGSPCIDATEGVTEEYVMHVLRDILIDKVVDYTHLLEDEATKMGGDIEKSRLEHIHRTMADVRTMLIAFRWDGVRGQ